MSILINSYASLCVGETKYLGLENNLTTHIIARVLRGIGSPGLYISSMPEF